jgi:hypothetical protein
MEDRHMSILTDATKVLAAAPIIGAAIKTIKDSIGGDGK